MKAYYQPRTEYAISATVTTDWGTVFAGYEVGTTSTEFDGKITKVDACGNILWSNIYGTSTLTETIQKVTVIPHKKGVVFVGGRTDPLTSRSAMLLGQINSSSGALVFAITFPESPVLSSSGRANDVIVVDEQRVLMVGSSTSSLGSKASTRLVTWKGDILSAYESVGAFSASYQAVAKTSNVGYVVIGNREASLNSWVGFVSLFNKYGDHLYSKQFVSSGIVNVQSVAQCRDGENVLVGSIRRPGSTRSSIAVTKLTAFGDSIEWAVSISCGGVDAPRRIISTHDGGYCVVGSTLLSSKFSTSDGLVVKLDKYRNIEWAKRFNLMFNKNERLTDIVELPGGGYRIFGEGVAYLSKPQAAFLIVTDAAGNLTNSGVGWEDIAALITVEVADIALTNVRNIIQPVAQDNGVDIKDALLTTKVNTQSKTIFSRGACDSRTSFLFSDWPTEAPTTSPTSSQPTRQLSPQSVSPTQSPSTSIPSSSFPTFSCPSSVPSAPPTASSSVPIAIDDNRTSLPTKSPSRRPTVTPTSKPSRRPSSSPTVVPTAQPTLPPTGHPSVPPTTLPSIRPTNTPTNAPSRRPSVSPTVPPTNAPRAMITKVDSHSPSAVPTLVPTWSDTDSHWRGANGQAGHRGIVIGLTLFITLFLIFRSLWRWRYGDKNYSVSDFFQDLWDPPMFETTERTRVRTNNIFHHNKVSAHTQFEASLGTDEDGITKKMNSQYATQPEIGNLHLPEGTGSVCRETVSGKKGSDDHDESPESTRRGRHESKSQSFLISPALGSMEDFQNDFDWNSFLGSLSSESDSQRSFLSVQSFTEDNVDHNLVEQFVGSEESTDRVIAMLAEVLCTDSDSPSNGELNSLSACDGAVKWWDDHDDLYSDDDAYIVAGSCFFSVPGNEWFDDEDEDSCSTAQHITTQYDQYEQIPYNGDVV